jgi:AraC-like DNA-binding protein
MKNLEELSFCLAIKYKKDKDYSCHFENAPRPCHNIAFIIEGEGTIISDNNEISVKRGDILFIPRNSTYVSYWKATPTCTYQSVHFNFPFNKDPFLYTVAPIQLLPNDNFETLFEMTETIKQYQGSNVFDSFLSLSAFYNLCGILLSKAKTKPTDNFDSCIKPAVVFLQNYYNKPCKITQLSALCYLSPSRFFYLFKKQVGCSPIVYKNKIAIQKASHDLVFNKDKSIETIAFEHGFASPIYFRRLFKKVTGTTPSQYRKQQILV